MQDSLTYSSFGMKLKPYTFIALLALLSSTSVLAGDLVGQVKYANGKPASDATVAISDGKHGLVSVQSDANGDFTSHDLAEGAYGITASTADSGAAFLARVPIPASGKSELVTLVLGNSGASIHGHVRTPTKALPPNMQIVAVRVSNDTGDNFIAKITGEQYQVSVIPGSYHLVARLNGWFGQSRTIHIPGNSPIVDLAIFPEQGSDPKLADEIVSMEERDQVARHQMIDHPNDAGIRAALAEVDKDNERRITQIIQEHGWPDPGMVGQKGTDAMWVLVQHGPAPLLKRCIPLMKLAVERGELPLDKVALSIDRDLINDGKKQLYGSQEGPIEDEAHVDQRRAEMDMGTLAEYRALLKQVYTPHPQQPELPDQN